MSKSLTPNESCLAALLGADKPAVVTTDAPFALAQGEGGMLRCNYINDVIKETLLTSSLGMESPSLGGVKGGLIYHEQIHSPHS